MKRTTYDEFQSSTTDDATGLKGNERKMICMVKGNKKQRMGA